MSLHSGLCHPTIRTVLLQIHFHRVVAVACHKKSLSTLANVPVSTTPSLLSSLYVNTAWELVAEIELAFQRPNLQIPTFVFSDPFPYFLSPLVVAGSVSCLTLCCTQRLVDPAVSVQPLPPVPTRQFSAPGVQEGRVGMNIWKKRCEQGDWGGSRRTVQSATRFPANSSDCSWA